MRGIYKFLAVSDHYPSGTCWAWLERAERVCGRPEGDDENLCPRHGSVARKRAQAHAAKVAARTARIEAWALAALPQRRERLARIEAEIARLDPPPPTTDMAAFGGVGSTVATRYRSKFTPERIHKLSILWEERVQLERLIAFAERVAEKEAS